MPASNFDKAAVRGAKEVAKAKESVGDFVHPITNAFNKLGKSKKIAVGAAGAGLAGAGLMAGRASKGNTTINKIGSDIVATTMGAGFELALEKIAAKKKKHPVSEAQRRWAFYAEDKGELPKGKAKKWSKRAEDKDLPEKTSADDIANAAFIDELQKLSGGVLEPEALAAVAKKGFGSAFKKANPAAATSYLPRYGSRSSFSDVSSAAGKVRPVA